MDENDIARRVSALPDRFADRVKAPYLEPLRSLAEAGEWGLVVEELLANLTADKAPVSSDERDELRVLLQGMKMPTDPIDALNIQG